MDPLVTIIIPSYNHENYIKETIDSVMKQTYKNIKLVVIDDGSTDNSHNIIKDCLDEYDNKFKYIRKKNEGLIKTLNFGLNFVEGKYYQPLASDDIIYKTKIERQVRYLENNSDYAMVYSDCHFFYEKHNFKIKASRDYNFKEGWIFDEIFSNVFSIPALSVLIRSDIVKRFKYIEKFKIEDWILWLRISYLYKIGYIDLPLALYRLHNNNMHSDYELMENEQRKVIRFMENNYDIDKELISITLNNFRFKNARNYKHGPIYCKKQFILGLMNKFKKKMTVNITIKDILKFIFRWW
jgi:alpha-1,3-rhamnosyltransferase